METQASLMAIRFGQSVRRFQSTAPGGGWTKFPQAMRGAIEAVDRTAPLGQTTVW